MQFRFFAQASSPFIAFFCWSYVSGIFGYQYWMDCMQSLFATVLKVYSPEFSSELLALLLPRFYDSKYLSVNVAGYDSGTAVVLKEGLQGCELYTDGFVVVGTYLAM
jgi:hypothetical protein